MFLGGGEEIFGAGPGDRAAPSLGGVLGPPLGMVLHVSGGAGPPPGMMQHVREGSRPPPRDDAVSSDVPPTVDLISPSSSLSLRLCLSLSDVFAHVPVTVT